MFKKILGLAICVVTLGLALVPVKAAADITWKTDVLRNLGIYQENPVTYDNFINSLAGFLYDNPTQIGSAEDIARITGMIESDEKYSGQSVLTVDKALKLAVITLGYKPALGTDGNYIKKAAELGVTGGIGANIDAKLKTDVAVEILYSMIKAEPLAKTTDGNIVASGDNLLSINRDIYEVKGILTGTDITSIYGQDGVAGNGHIKINEISYFAGEKNYDQLLGKSVIAYMQQSDYLGDTALYIGEMENKNTTLTIDCDDITDIGDSISYISYEKENERAKKIDIVVSPRVIYNGMFLEDYVEDDFRHGVLELIDNDEDRKYDIIKISAYKTIIVESVVTREMIIKNRYRFKNWIPDKDWISELSLNTEKDSDIKFKIFDSSGSKMEFSDIKVDDVLSVTKSRDGKLINIYISGDKKIEGNVTGIYDTEDIVEIDNESYKKSEDFKNYLSEAGKTIQAGNTHTFYIDYFGKIAYMKESAYNNYNVLLKVTSDDAEEEYYIVHMDINGDWYTSPVYEKVKIDGIRPVDLKTAMNALKTESPQVVILKFNSQNQVTSIDTSGVVNDSEFCKKEAPDYYYRSEDRYFELGNYLEDDAHTIYLEDNAKVIVFPSDNIDDVNNWKVYGAGSFFKGDVQYSIDCFNLDEFMFTDLVTVVQSQDITRAMTSKAMYVVTGFETVFIDEEVHPVIKGSVDGFMNLSFVGKDVDEFDGLNKGDVINFTLDHNGMIEYVDTSTVFSLTKFKNIVGTYNDHSRYAGKVVNISSEEGKMVLDCGTNDNPILIPFRVNPNMQVTVYNDDDECESMPLNFVSKEDNLLIRVSYGKINEIVCVKN